MAGGPVTIPSSFLCPEHLSLRPEATAPELASLEICAQGTSRGWSWWAQDPVPGDEGKGIAGVWRQKEIRGGVGPWGPVGQGLGAHEARCARRDLRVPGRRLAPLCVCRCYLHSPQPESTCRLLGGVASNLPHYLDFLWPNQGSPLAWALGRWALHPQVQEPSQTPGSAVGGPACR